MKIRPYIVLIMIILVGAILGETEPAPALSTATGAGAVTALAGNPAATYCEVVMGYDYEIITGEHGEQSAVCHMPDGEACSQWDFYAGTCGADFSYCAQQGLTLNARSDGQDPYAPSYSVCTSPTTRESFPVADVIAEATTCTIDSANLAPETDQAGFDTSTPGQPQAPTAFDWRSESGSNWVTTVKDQASCGSCWSFAAMGSLEAAWNILTSNPALDLDLAEQHLVSPCSDNGSCGDCGGGSSTCSLWAAVNYGIPDEACFPYTATDTSCSGRCSDWASRVTYAPNRVYTWSPTQANLKEYISRHGPVAVYLGVGSSYNAYWDGDIYRCRDDSGINHAVLAVGYSDSGGYWIIKNSWGSSWNDDGYFKVGYGECAVDTTVAAFIDTKDPESNHSLSGTLGDNSWYTSTITVNLSATDSYGSGVDVIQYYLNSGSWVDDSGSSASTSIASDGTHTFYYRAVDNGGNVESTHSFSVKRDATNPTNPASVSETGCGTADGGSTTCTDPAFNWSVGTDVTSGVAGYGIYFGTSASGTGATFNPAPTYDPGTVSDGTYYLRLRTKDNAGNWSGWQTMYTLTVDNTAPTSSHGLSGTSGDNGWYTSDITVDLSATDSSGSGVDYIEYHLDAQSWTQVYDTSTSTSITSDGTYTLYYRSADVLGNLESTHNVVLKRDTVPPVNPSSAVETACGADSGVASDCGDPAFSWIAGTDATSDVAGYGIYFGTSASGTGTTFSAAATYDPGSVSDGTYYLRLRTKDNAGNWSGWETMFSLVVDSTAPVSAHVLGGTSGENGWYTSNINIDLSATDSSGSGVDYLEYHLDAQSWTQVYDTSTSISIISDGTYTLYYRSADVVGNLESTHTVALKRDTVDPTNPGSVIETDCGAASGTATDCGNPAFSWSAGTDATSTVAGYGVYFGTSAAGTDAGSLTTSLNYDPGTVTDGTYYLRLRTKDLAGNWSGWETMFTLVVEGASVSFYLPMVLR